MQRETYEGGATLEAMVLAHMAVAVTDADMRFMRHSPRFLSEMGIVGHDIVGRTIAEIFPSVVAAHGEVIAASLAGQANFWEAAWLELPSGVRACLRCEVSPWRLSDGAIGGLLIFVHDVTAMQDALERSGRAERRLKVATEIANLHVFEADFVNGALVSEGAADSFYDRPLTFEMLSQDPFCGVHPEDRPRVMMEFMEADAAGRPHRTEYRVAREDGVEVWAFSAVESEKDADGTLLRVVGAMQNVTERKHAERDLIAARDSAEAANRAKSEFLASISHEIRTPLNGVLGMAQAMAADDLAAPQRERLDVLHRSGEMLLSLLNDVLDLAKIEAGKIELEAAPFDFDQLARGVVAAHTPQANRKGVSVGLVIDPKLRGAFLGDATRLRQVLHNLVSNAVKFTEAGVVTIGANYDGGRLRLEISDTGIGVERHKLEGLFDKFVQADPSTTRRYGGTGLGLAICRDLVVMMGGVITVDSEPGRGSTFTVELPLARTTAAAQPAAAPRAGKDAPLPPLRILAAEDNEVNQLVLRTLLTQVGVEVTIVGDGVEAVAAFAPASWDVVLMDVHMPVMDGIAATRLIRQAERDQGAVRTPIIALTANAMTHQRAEYIAAGMDSLIAKPIRAAELYEVLQQTLDGAFAKGEPARRAS